MKWVFIERKDGETNEFIIPKTSSLKNACDLSLFPGSQKCRLMVVSDEQSFFISVFIQMMKWANVRGV